MQHNLTEAQIRKRLIAYLTGKTSLQAFQEWFVPATWHIETGAPARLQELVYGVKLRLAEYTSGHWSKADLRIKLLPYVTYFELRIGTPHELQPWSRSSDKSITFSPPIPARVRIVPHQASIRHGQYEVACV